MRRFLDQPVWVRVLRGILLAAVVAVAAAYTPTPYLLEAPGRAVLASTIITIDHKDVKPVNGQFLMTTVLVEKASVMLCIYGLIDPDARLTRTLPADLGEQAQSPNDSRQMELSQYLSTWVALEKLGYKVRGKYVGLLIVGVDRASPNFRRLQPGDLIVELAGKTLPTLEDFRELTRGKTSQDKLQGTVRRAGKKVPVEMTLIEIEGRMRIGVVLRPEHDKVDLPVDIRFQSGTTSGASAGLVFALEIYDQLGPGDLARGRNIAATGTLDAFGRVGGIEGLPFKLIAAERAGAELFVVPRENWDEIKNTPTKLKIIPVDTFEEAINALD